MRILILFLFSLFDLVWCDWQVQQTLSFSIQSTSHLEINGPAPVLAVAGPGQGWYDSSYSVLTNEENKKISASLNTDMPDGVTLYVELSPPKGARSLGAQVLSSTPVDLVVEITRVSQSGLLINYTLDIQASATPVSSATRLITYTLMDG